MKTERVPVSPGDEAFAGAVIKLMDAAVEEIIYASGEGTTLLLSGVMAACDEAIQRGVVIRGYLAKPHIRILSDVMARDEIYLGKERPKEHLLIIDRKHELVPISHKEGEKEGWIYWDDEERAKNGVRKFEELISSDEIIRSPFGQAERFYKEALEEFKEGKKTKDDVRIRSAAEKAYASVVQAANNLILKMGGEGEKDNIRSFHKREDALSNYAGEEMRDSYMARMRYLHKSCFYEGVYGIEELEEELHSVGEFIEDCVSVLIEGDDKIVSDTLEAIKEYKNGLGRNFKTTKELLDYLTAL